MILIIHANATTVLLVNRIELGKVTGLTAQIGCFEGSHSGDIFDTMHQGINLGSEETIFIEDILTCIDFKL